MDMSVGFGVIWASSASAIDVVSGVQQYVAKANTRKVSSSDRSNTPGQARGFAIGSCIHLASAIAGALEIGQSCMSISQYDKGYVLLTCNVTVTVCCLNFFFRSSIEYDSSSPSESSI